MTQIDSISGLGLALLLGWLIGAERGWQARDEETGTRVAGIRTFALIALLGGLAGTQVHTASADIMLMLIVGAVAAMLLGYRADMQRARSVSATTTVAAILTLGWGVAAGAGAFALASVGTGATLLLLASRRVLHGMLQKVSEADLQATMRLVLVVLIIYPLLPDTGLGPFGALNPRRIWLVVVTTGAISFGGYVLARWLGERHGLLLGAAIGSLVSSTAVTVEAGRQVREQTGGRGALAAVPLASAVMVCRSLVLVALLAPFALATFAEAVLPAFAISLAATFMLLRGSDRADVEASHHQPKAPGLGLAFTFAASVALLALLSAWVSREWGDGAAIVIIAGGGTVDIDAAIAAVGALPAGTLAEETATFALILPTLLNTLFKLALFVGLAGWRRGNRAAASLLAVALSLGTATGYLALRL